MKRLGLAKIFLFAAILLLVLGIVFGVVSLFPSSINGSQSRVLIDDTFKLSQNETRRQGLGSFYGGENVSVLVQCPTAFQKNFSVVTYNGTRYANFTDQDIAYTFTTDANYYEAVFFSNAINAGTIHFQVSVQELNITHPYSWLNEAAKIMFLVGLGLVMLVTLQYLFSKFSKFKPIMPSMPSFSKRSRRILIGLLLVSLVFWLVLVAVNQNPLGTLENWYTDHPRHSYVSSLFLKDGFAIFSEPLGKLASMDNSAYKFVTWPEMPHLYPLGSVFLFLPFGVLLQSGFDPVLIYKLEITVFLFFASVCLYFFLKNFLKKDLDWPLKILGVAVIYLTLMVYAADGMFDSVAFLFCLLAISMFLMERYDYFFLLIAVSVFFKYQAGIFLFPIIVVGMMKLFEKNNVGSLLKNKAVIGGAVFGGASLFTAYLSAPYLLAVKPQFIMNSLNAFSANPQISWALQSFAVLLTLTVTLAYSAYMLNKNRLLSLSALFLLLPSFMLPYFQNWYIPFIFVYILIPQHKKELAVTMMYLVFMIGMLYLGGVSFNVAEIFKYITSFFKP